MAMENDVTCLAEHYDYLSKYAMIHLRDPEAARDVVQETMAAAIASWQGFNSRSAVLTWLVAILKFKIVDWHRQTRREQVEHTAGNDAGPVAEDLDADEGWAEAASRWGSPDQALERKEFLDALERCLSRLPAQTAQVFALREIMGESIESICQMHGITRTNCSVMLHRARTHLRRCLERDWP